MSYPQYLAVAADGSVFITDTGDSHIRKVDPSGIITTFAGGWSPYPSNFGDGGPAAKAQLVSPTRLVVTADGSVFIHDYVTIRVVDPRGKINVFAGKHGEDPGTCPDTGTARATRLHPNADGLALGPDGALYLSDSVS